MDQAHAIETNLWAMQRDFARYPGTIVHDEPDLLWFSTPGSNAWFNGASWCRLGDDAEARIDTVGRTAQEVGSRAQWLTSPSCGPSDLPLRLEAAGWEPEAEPGMALAVDAPLPPPPAELLIEQVDSTRGVREWTDLFDASFGIDPPRGDEHPWLDPWRHLTLGDGSPFRLFLGRLEGSPVSCSLAFHDQESVGLYGIGTPPEHRGKGYGSALTVAGIRWGAERGATVAVLQASPMGAPVYRSLGFQDAFDMTSWSLPPS